MADSQERSFDSEGRFTRQRVRELQHAIDQVLAEKRQMHEWLGLLEVCIGTLSLNTDTTAMWEVLLEIALSVGLADSGSIFVNDVAAGRVRGEVRVAEGQQLPFGKRAEFPHGQGIAGAAAQLRHPLVHPGNGTKYFVEPSESDITSIIGVPILLADESDVSAVLCLNASGASRPFTDQAVTLLKVLCRVAAVAREQQQLAMTDPTTGLLNRRAYERDLNRLLDGASSAIGLAIIYLDVDNLGDLNKKFDGDRVDVALRELGSVLGGVMNEHAGCDARVYKDHTKGDEFVITSRCASDATALAEECIDAVRARAFCQEHPDGAIPAGDLTVSAGATWAVLGETPTIVEARAQDAKRQAKEKPGKCACVTLQPGGFGGLG